MFSLSSSHSYLDGVPFKISAAFRPNAQPSLPPELLRASEPCEAFHEEYAFDTEEAVLAWSRAREEAKAKAIADRQTAERARAAVAAAESSSSDSEDDAANGDDQSAPAGQAVKSVEPEGQTVRPPWQLPVGASLSSTILTPTPIQISQKAQSPMAPKTTVDLALFEKEEDPFDNMELQTINDMEELRTLLGGTGVDDGQGPSQTSDSQTLKTANDGEVALAVDSSTSQEPGNGKSTISCANNIFSNIPGVKMYESNPSDSVRSSAVPSNVNNKTGKPSSSSSATAVEPTFDDDYVQIRSDYSKQSVHFQRDSDAAHSKSSSDGVLGGKFPQQFGNNKLFKPLLPPIRPRGKSLGGEVGSDAASGTSGDSSASSVTQAAIPQSNRGPSFMGNGMSQSAYVMSTSSSAADMPVSDLSWIERHPNLSGGQSHPGDGAMGSALSSSMYSRYHNLGSESPTPVNGVGAEQGRLRSAKSNPDLLARSSSPYGGRAHDSSQPWNPYRPLPPTPVPDLRSGSVSPERRSSDYGFSPPPHPPSSSVSSSAVPASQPEFDPYPALSSEAKTFVNNLTSMGFSRSRVSRAVEKFGTDEKEVVDHLLNVDKLVEKKVTCALAETSLHLFRNNMWKAEQFLSLYQQFTELGFAGDRIQTALVKHELDRDRALDYLTTT